MQVSTVVNSLPGILQWDQSYLFANKVFTKVIYFRHCRSEICMRHENMFSDQSVHNRYRDIHTHTRPSSGKQILCNFHLVLGIEP